MKQSKLVSTPCPQCGTMVSYWPSWPRIYCSRSCAQTAANLRRPTQGVATLACEQCGKTFTRANSENKKVAHHFCSQRCFGDWQARKTGESHPLYKRTKYTCSQCSKSFWRSPAVARDYTEKFCNLQCKAAWLKTHPPEHKLPPMYGAANPKFKGGPDYRGPNWLPQKRNARRRDGYVCQHCGITEAQLGKHLDVHHIIPFKTFGPDRYQEANRMANLISLCPSCHHTAEHAAKRQPTT